MPRPTPPRAAQLEHQAEPGDDLADAPAPLELGELDALTLPRSLAALPAALPLPPCKALPQPE